MGGKRFDLIVAVGGGSVIDAAKVISVGLSEDGITTSGLLDKDQSRKPVKTRLIAVPTTSGTGAEITPFATIWDDVEKKKLSYGPDMKYRVLVIILALKPKLTMMRPMEAAKSRPSTHLHLHQYL